jgi:hypothetical protein
VVNAIAELCPSGVVSLGVVDTDTQYELPVVTLVTSRDFGHDRRS